MNAKSLAIVAGASLLLGLTVVRGAQAPAPIENPANALLAEIAAGQFDRAVARFNGKMTAALPAEKLAAVWNGLIAQCGAFKGVDAAREERIGATRLVILVCRFSNVTLDARVAIDSNGQVSGLFFAPHEASDGEWKAPAYARPESFTEREVTVGTGRWTLPGTLTVPRGDGPRPAVVLVHGSGPNDRDETLGPNKPFKDLAWGLASRGIVVLRYEKRTKAHPEESKAAMADPNGFTVNEETVEDARLAVALLAGQREVDPKRVAVLGHSLGGMLAPRIATGDSAIAGLVVFAGNTRPLEVMVLDQVRYLANLEGNASESWKKQIAAAEETVREVQDPALKPGVTVRFLGIPMPSSYFLDLRGYRPAEAAAALHLPMLVVRGGRDYQVTAADFEGWRNALGARSDVTFKLYPSLNHLFIAGSGPSSAADTLKSGHVAEEVVSDVAGWIGALPGGRT